MTVTISTYRGYSISDIKTRAEVPEQSHIVTGTTDASCNNINITKIARILGVDTSTSLRNLCLHPNVNKWSAFSPYTRDVSGTPDASGNGAYLKHVPPTRYRTSYWAGYNHDASIPRIANTVPDPSSTLTIASGGTAVFDCTPIIGELKLIAPDIVNKDPQGLAFIVWDSSSNIVGYEVHPLSTYRMWESFQIRKEGVTTDGSYNCQIRLVDSTSAYTYSPTNVICAIEELPDYTKVVRVHPATYVLVTGNRTGTFGSSGAAPSYNLATGAIFSNGFTISANATTLTIRAWIETWDASILTDIYYLRNAAAGAYTAGTNVITQNPVVYTDPGSTTRPQLNRVIWTNGGITKGLPFPSYDVVIRIDIVGT